MATIAPAAATDLPPIEVQLSTLSWVGAVGAGGVEMVLMVADGLGTEPLGPLAAGVGVRLVAFAVLLALAGRLWRGNNWARWTLAGVFGVLGQASMLIGPVGWLAEHDLGALHTDPKFVAFASVRASHILCVLIAVALMFLPAANAHFRRSLGTRRPAPDAGRPVPT